MTIAQAGARSRGWRWWRRATAALAVLALTEWALDYLMHLDLAIWGALYVLAWLGR
jgi:hypothetical protein